MRECPKARRVGRPSRGGFAAARSEVPMSRWTRRIPFKVDVAGVIQIMGTSLYSRSDAAFRELIQNAHDAVMRRRRGELSYKGRIDIVQHADGRTISVSDDGIGL